MTAHAGLGWFLLSGFSRAPQVRVFIQAGSARFVGPILLILGILLLGWLRGNAPTCSIDTPGSLRDRLRERIPPGDAGATVLGLLLSLLPCPETAALFFGGLLPLALAEEAPFAYPALFGLGAAIPVGALGLTLAAGTRAFSGMLSRLSEAETWIRRISGGLFLAVGFYLTLVHTYGF
jgi:cytochrome c biogenesis protein CcdA